jgi:CheY-like chemotaxis protein
MGGTITVDSEPSRGSTFAFTARFGRQPHPPERPQVRLPALLRDLPVLVVDDNATNRHILAEWLRGWGMRPAEVGDAAAALNALRQAAARGRPYPLVLLDARMPDTDGLALAGQVRQDPALSATRIILLTSGDRPGAATRARELRIDAHLLKPVQPDELLGTIHRVLQRNEGRRIKDEGRESSPQPPGSSLTPHPSALRILVAEDNDFNAQLLGQLLGRRGHRVRVAANGREALALAEAGAYDLLLLDIHMPELDGFQVVGAIRERERTTGGHLPVIALTARSRPEDRERCLAVGMDDFLTKPIRAADLWAAVERLGRKDEGRRMRDAENATAASGSSFIPAPSALIDPRAVLAACGGDAAILGRIGQAFRAGLPRQLEEVRAALRDADAARLREAAHRLSGMVGAFSTAAGGVASEIEDCAAAGQLDAAPVLVDRLDAMARELIRLAGGLSIESLRRQAEAAGGPHRTTGRRDQTPEPP